MKNKYFLKFFLIISLSLLYLELLFKGFSFNILDISLIKVILFTLATSLTSTFIFTLFKPIICKILSFIFVFVCSFYTLLQLSFKNFMDNYMSIRMLTGGGEASRLSNEISTFIKDINPLFYLCFIPIIVIIILYIWKRKSFIYQKPNWKFTIFMLLTIISIHLISLGTLYIKPLDGSNLKSSKDLYRSPTLVDAALKEFGVIRFIQRDIIYTIKGEEDQVIDLGDPIVPDKPVNPDYSRIIDDTDWQAILNKTDDKVLANLHQYYMNQPITPKNTYTGMFEGKNLIMIMVEAFDMVAIDKELTPTLYKMQQEGWYFNNYYAPKFSCTTGESEFISLTSIIPANTVCTPYTYVNNSYDTSIFNLFNKSDYTSTSYHSWDDQYYPRKTLHKNMGSSAYYNGNDLKVKTGPSWPSDVDLMKKSYKIYSKEDKFFSFVITVSMHFTYDRDTKVVTDNWNKVKDLNVPTTMKRYLAKAVDFNKSMEYLLTTLEQDNKLDDTVIVLFGDHHPYNLNFDYINDLSSVDRYQDLNEDLMPMIIYNHGQEAKQISKIGSTFDLVPTLANLFNLDYDPRYYTGVDLFSDSESIAIFPSGNWVTDNAIYFANKNQSKPLTDKATDEYIKNINTIVGNKFTASDNVLKKDYFKYRFVK